MARFRRALTQLRGSVFLADGGLETCLIYMQGVDLPCFAAFPLVADEAGRALLERYFEPYLRTARERGVGFILDTPTWRANPDWGERLGYSALELAALNRQAAAWAAGMRDTHASGQDPIVINGALRPRGDAYWAEARMRADEAERYHRPQIECPRDSEADMVSAMTYAEEAVGVARAAQACDMPVVIPFTVEIDGRLPSQ